MVRYPFTVLTSWFAGLAFVVITPSQVASQRQDFGPAPAAVFIARQAEGAPSRTWLAPAPGWAYQARRGGSAGKTIVTHTLVGTGAGLLIGLVLSGATVGDHRTSVVLTWTAVGAASGVVSGVVTWLIGRGQ